VLEKIWPISIVYPMGASQKEPFAKLETLRDFRFYRICCVAESSTYDMYAFASGRLASAAISKIAQFRFYLPKNAGNSNCFR